MNQYLGEGCMSVPFVDMLLLIPQGGHIALKLSTSPLPLSLWLWFDRGSLL